MEQTQTHQTKSLSVDKRTKEYKEAMATVSHPLTQELIKVGFVQLHGTLFFGGKNFKEKIDVRVDKSRGGHPLEITYDRSTKELTIKADGCVMHLPSTSVFGYTPINHVAAKVTPFSGIGANTNINAQVSGPHDHVFQGLGNGQTGVGKAIK